MASVCVFGIEKRDTDLIQKPQPDWVWGGRKRSEKLGKIEGG